MLLYLFFASIAIILFLLSFIFVPYLKCLASGESKNCLDISIFLTVVTAGTLGAFFSALIRLYDFKDLPKALFNNEIAKDRLSLFIYSLVPALVGGIAAAIMYFLFGGNLLTGGLFPKFSCLNGHSCLTFNDTLFYYAPSEAADYARIIFWGFVAGFAERMVPDLLGNFAQSHEIQSAGQASLAEGVTDKTISASSVANEAGNSN